MIPGYAKIVLAALLWSTGSVFIRIVNLPLAEYIFSVSLVAVLVIIAKMLLQGRVGKLAVKNRKSMAVLLLVGIISLINIGLYLMALRITTLANAVFSHYLAPVLVPVFAFLLIKERVGRETIIALIIAMIGLFVILVPQGFELSNVHVLGILIGAGSAVFFGFETVVRKYSTRILKPDVIVTWMLLIFMAATALASDFQVILSMGSYSLMVVIIAGIITSAIPFLLFMSGIKEVKAQHAGILTYFEVLGVVVWGVLVFSEIPYLATLVGGGLIAIAGILVIRYHKEGKP
jgi:drug/metabolite transporter (DMT)-like permease